MKTIDSKSFLIGALFTLLVIVSTGAQEAQTNELKTDVPAYQVDSGGNYAYVIRTGDGMTWSSFQGGRLKKIGAPK